MQKQKIVIAGFGDTGILTAINLSKKYEIVGISPKPCLFSGQELGTRLTQPEKWQENYVIGFDRYKHLDGVKVEQGLVDSINADKQSVTVLKPNGEKTHHDYDVLLIASGVKNGFWRKPTFEGLPQIKDGLASYAQQISEAKELAVVGGGPTGVSSALNIAKQYSDKPVYLYYSQDLPLSGYHLKVRQKVAQQLQDAGVNLRAKHRAVLEQDKVYDNLGSGEITWSTGQASVNADCILWAVGQTLANNTFIPNDMLNEQGFVKANEFLQVQGYENVFVVGDIAASDKNRSSARNWGFQLVAHNIECYLSNRSNKMKKYKASENRWGSIVGVQENGLEVFQAGGGSFRFPAWSIDRILFPLFVRKMIYKGFKK